MASTYSNTDLPSRQPLSHYGPIISNRVSWPASTWKMGRTLALHSVRVAERKGMYVYSLEEHQIKQWNKLFKSDSFSSVVTVSCMFCLELQGCVHCEHSFAVENGCSANPRATVCKTLITVPLVVHTCVTSRLLQALRNE